MSRSRGGLELGNWLALVSRIGEDWRTRRDPFYRRRRGLTAPSRRPSITVPWVPSRSGLVGECKASWPARSTRETPTGSGRGWPRKRHHERREREDESERAAAEFSPRSPSACRLDLSPPSLSSAYSERGQRDSDMGSRRCSPIAARPPAHWAIGAAPVAAGQAERGGGGVVTLLTMCMCP